jgi:hypothetical protein
VSQPKHNIGHIQYCTSGNRDEKAYKRLRIYYYNSTIAFTASMRGSEEGEEEGHADKVDFSSTGKTKMMFLNPSPRLESVNIIYPTPAQMIAPTTTYKQCRGYIKLEPGNAFRMKINGACSTIPLKGPKTNRVASFNGVYKVWTTGFCTIPLQVTRRVGWVTIE